MRRAWWVALGALVAGLVLVLVGGQSYRDGVAMICEVPTLSGARDQPPGMAASTIADYLQANLSNPRAKSLWQRILWADSLEKDTLLQREVETLDLERCEILDLGG